MRLEKLFEDICNKYPDRIAAIENEKEVTYKELLQNAHKVSNCIITYCNTRNQHIGLIFNNQVEFIYSMFGILLSGNIVVPIPCNGTETEINGIIANCDIDLCIADDKLSKSIKSVKCFTWSECSMYNGMKSHEQLDNQQSVHDVAFIFSTSGSTGVSKAVQLTHINIYESAKSHSKSLDLNGNDKFLVTMPFHLSHGVSNVVMACIMSLTTIVIYRVPIIPRKMSSILNRHKITVFSSVPTYMALFIKYQNNHYDFPSVKTVIISGAKLYENLYMEIKKSFKNADVLHTYGLTEASPRVSMMTRDSKILSSGKPVSGVEVRVVNEQGNILDVNEVGEIQVKGNNVMKGYYKNESLTKETIVNGWLITGDLGKIDEYGNLHIVSRKKNIVISGGQNIYPEEIEEKLLACDSVKEIVAFGYPDEIYGEIVLAIMTVNDKDAFYKKDKNQFEKSVSLYKIPKEYFIVDSLPKTTTDKIDRKECKKMGCELYRSNQK